MALTIKKQGMECQRRNCSFSLFDRLSKKIRQYKKVYCRVLYFTLEQYYRSLLIFLYSHTERSADLAGQFVPPLSIHVFIPIIQVYNWVGSRLPLCEILGVSWRRTLGTASLVRLP